MLIIRYPQVAIKYPSSTLQLFCLFTSSIRTHFSTGSSTALLLKDPPPAHMVQSVVCAVEVQVGYAQPVAPGDQRPSPRPECGSWDGKCGSQIIDRQTCGKLKGCRRIEGEVRSSSWSSDGDVCTIGCTANDSPAESEAVNFDKTMKQEGEAQQNHLAIEERESLVMFAEDRNFKSTLRWAWMNVTQPMSGTGILSIQNFTPLIAI